MKKYMIFHPCGGKRNDLCLTEGTIYIPITTVRAQNIQDALDSAQKENPSYERLGVRNTDTGDIIISERTGTLYMVVPSTKRFQTVKPEEVNIININKDITKTVTHPKLIEYLN